MRLLLNSTGQRSRTASIARTDSGLSRIAWEAMSDYSCLILGYESPSSFVYSTPTALGHELPDQRIERIGHLPKHHVSGRQIPQCCLGQSRGKSFGKYRPCQNVERTCNDQGGLADLTGDRRCVVVPAGMRSRQ